MSSKAAFGVERLLKPTYLGFCVVSLNKKTTVNVWWIDFSKFRFNQRGGGSPYDSVMFPSFSSCLLGLPPMIVWNWSYLASMRNWTFSCSPKFCTLPHPKPLPHSLLALISERWLSGLVLYWPLDEVSLFCPHCQVTLIWPFDRTRHPRASVLLGKVMLTREETVLKTGIRFIPNFVFLHTWLNMSQ